MLTVPAGWLGKAAIRPVIELLGKFLVKILLLFYLSWFSWALYPPSKLPMAEQLPLFHWWNVCAEDALQGPDASRLPVHEGGLVFGRSGFQWIKAVSAYLEFRAGSAWRPESHRFNPVYEHYVECLRVVHSAYYQNVNWWAASIARLPAPVPAKNSPKKKAGIA